MSTVIETFNLSKTYNGTVEALKSLNLSVKRGESVAFLGPNGAGKTTYIQILLNLIKPTSGSVNLFDQPMHGQERELLQSVGSLVGMPGYYDKLTADDTLKYVAKVYKMSNQEKTLRINQVLEDVGLADARFRKVGTFSTGMKRRLGIAQILIHDPELIILDEPTNGLDPKGVREVRDVIKEINKSGKTVFMTTHNLTEVDEISQRVIFLNFGDIVGDEQLNDLKKKLGSNQIEVKFLRDLSIKEEEIILSIENVKDVLRTDATYINYAGGENTTHYILKDMLREELPVYSFTPKTLSLEDIYLKIYGAGGTGVSL